MSESEETAKEEYVANLANRSPESFRELPLAIKQAAITRRVLLPSALTAKISTRMWVNHLQAAMSIGEGFGTLVATLGGKPEIGYTIAGGSKVGSLTVEWVDLMLDRRKEREKAQQIVFGTA